MDIPSNDITHSRKTLALTAAIFTEDKGYGDIVQHKKCGVGFI